MDLSGPPKSILRDHLGLGGMGPAGRSIAVNSFYIEMDGKPFIPVVGEFHYSRYPADEWENALLKMQAGGINVAATYVFWNLHERQRGVFDWAGDLDLRRFVETVGRVGLQMILRIGPFAHGEMRNGALPDWLYGQPFEVRSNDPLYLECCDHLYRQIAAQVTGLLFADGGPIIGVQLENEYQHSAAPWDVRYAGAPIERTVADRDAAVTHVQVSVSRAENRHAAEGRDHLTTLKQMARRHGMDVPLYTATGWGNAAIVPDGSVPVMAAYPYPTWEKEARPSPFYRFKDIHQNPDYQPVSYDPTRYPSIAAELGAGMMQTYARRSFVPEESIEPMIVRILGSGSNGVGYYMYHGGATPTFDGVYYNEDASGLPKINYDYQAPLGQYGQSRSHYQSLRLLHHFLASFGDRLAPLPTILPADSAAISPADIQTLRYAARGANGRGFLFLVNFQDHVATRDLTDLKLAIGDGRRSITIPHEGVLTLKDGTAAILPINLQLGRTTLRSATVQPLSILSCNGSARYVFFSIDGMPPELVFESAAVGDAQNCSVTPLNGGTIIRGPAGACFSFVVEGTPVLVVPRAMALQATALPDGRLAFSDGCLLPQGGKLAVSSPGRTSVQLHVYPSTAGQPAITGAAIESIAAPLNGISSYRIQFTPVQWTAHWRHVGGRRYAVRFDGNLGSLNDVLMRVNYAGDTGMAFIDGQLVDDHFYCGRPWEIGLKRFLPRLRGKEMVFLRARPDPSPPRGSSRPASAPVRGWKVRECG